MRPRFSDERGLAGTLLIIVIAWGLSAVLMLTGTLIAAQQIEDEVVSITSTLSSVDEDTDNVALTQDINTRASDILTAAEPLTGQLDQVIPTARRIDEKVPRILTTAQDINATARSINGQVTRVGETVDSILDSFVEIEDNVVQSIEPGVDDIVMDLQRVIGLARSIFIDFEGIVAETGPIRREAIKIEEDVEILGTLTGDKPVVANDE